MQLFGFTTLFFILIFLPAMLLLYWRCPAKLQNPILLLGSLVFYGAGDLHYLALLVVLLVVNYCLYRATKIFEKTREFAILILTVNIGLLVGLKYFNLVKTLPIGVSFYIFSLVAFQIDAWKNKEDETVSFLKFATFISMFPKLLMGPIVRYKDYKESLDTPRIFSRERLEKGIGTFMFGMAMKLFLADTLASLVTAIRVGGAAVLTTDLAWLGAIVYTLELYFDFWGYSKMAIGLGEMLGFDLPDNFNHPYCSKTVGEFYRRWHITLGAWFRDYVYIPMGGSRQGVKRTVLNLLLVWILTGMWHGEHLNFIVWGLFLFAFIALEKATPLGKIKDTKILSHIYVLFVILISWVIFSITDFGEMYRYLLCMMGKVSVENTMFGPLTLRYLRQYGLFIGMGVFFLTPIPENWFIKNQDKNWMKLVLVIFLNVAIYYIWQGQSNPFLYFGY